MQPDDVRRARSGDERAKALSIWAVVTVLCFTAGLVISLRGIGYDLIKAPSPAQGSLQPRTVDGTVTYVRVDNGGHAIACSSTYSSSNCATVGVVLTRRGPK